MIGLSALFWSTLGLALVLGSVTVGLVLEIIRGHVAVTVPWGRRPVGLAERTVEIRASRHVVVEALRAAARGKGSPSNTGERSMVIDEERDLILSESLTRSRYGLIRSIELVRVASDRVTYRHLDGPLPGTEEEFVLAEGPEGTRVTYRGRIPVSFWGVGRLVARALIVPEYERLVAKHMEQLKQVCEPNTRPQ